MAESERKPAELKHVWVTEFRYRKSPWLLRPESCAKTKASSRWNFDHDSTPKDYYQIRTVKFVREVSRG